MSWSDYAKSPEGRAEYEAWERWIESLDGSDAGEAMAEMIDEIRKEKYEPRAGEVG